MDTWSASALLALTPFDGERLFGGDATLTYRRLLRVWHPDRNPHPQAADVFHRIRELWRQRRGAAPSSERFFEDAEGHRYRARFDRSEPFELGEAAFGQRHTFWFLRNDVRDRFEAAQRSRASCRFADARMKAAFEPLLPQGRFLWGPSGGLVETPRLPGFWRLRSLLAHHPDGLPPRHVAWMVSALLNLACYLEHTGVVHQALLADYVWVDAATHRIALPGAWFYAAAAGERIHALPGAALDVAPRTLLDQRIAMPVFDRQLILALGRELLGDRTGMRLTARTDVPYPLTAALRLPAARTAQEHYRSWKQALQEAFGPPRFVTLDAPTHPLD